MPDPQESLLSLPRPNEEFAIKRDEEITLYIGDERVAGCGTAKVRWFPRPRVAFETQLEAVSLASVIEGRHFSLEFDGSVETPVMTTKWSTPPEGTEATFTARRQPFSIRAGDHVDRVFVYLLNFPELFATARGPLTIQGGNWRISMRQVAGAKGIFETLNDTGGYAFTHLCEVSRTDGNTFSTDDAEAVLSSLHFFLSFAAGCWTPPVFPVGLNTSDEVVWEEWGFGKNQAFGRGRSSWLDKFQGASLQDVFPGFYVRWTSATWRKPLNDIIYWYLAANSQETGADTGIILIQAALELFAWTSLTQSRQCMSEEKFEAMSAAGPLRKVLSEAEIPLEVPAALEDLSQLAAIFAEQYGDQSIDGPKIFTEIRNSLVHPKEKRVGKHKFGNVLYEAFLLGQWYIDLLLLRLFDYSGEYANRCTQEWVGETELVPWASRE